MTHDRACEIHNQLYGETLPLCICPPEILDERISLAWLAASAYGRQNALQQAIEAVEELYQYTDIPQWNNAVGAAVLKIKELRLDSE